jgi:type 1 fimbria pilin
MDKVSTKDFTGVGATASPKTVTIPLNCNAGTKVSVTLDGTRHSSGIAGVLALDSSGSTSVATGLGLQLLYNNTAVTLGSATSVGATTSNGTYNVGLTARYYQTAATVTAGQANSTATFTMTYN